jgi:hypothetical protein
MEHRALHFPSLASMLSDLSYPFVRLRRIFSRFFFPIHLTYQYTRDGRRQDVTFDGSRALALVPSKSFPNIQHQQLRD